MAKGSTLMDKFYFPDLSEAEKLRLFLQLQDGEFTQHLFREMANKINFSLRADYYPKIKDENGEVWLVVASCCYL